MQPNKIMHIDLECENYTYYGALASPRHPQNYVVAVGQAIDGPEGYGPVTGEYYTSPPEKWLHIPDDVWLLVAHNAPFEMDWFLEKQRDEIMRFLARGGRVFCTAYAEYLLTNQQETYPSLDETAPKYGGTHKVDGVKILWEQGKRTSEIDKDLLLEYLLGPGGDIENTRKTFYGQYAALNARGMLPMVFARMDGMLSNCFAMHAGLHIDRDVAYAQLEAGNARLSELHAVFSDFRKAIPDYVNFKVSSDYHMSAWLFGGPIKYRIQDTWFEEDGITPKYEKDDFYKFSDGHLEPVANFKTEGHGTFMVNMHGPAEKYKSGKNKGQPKVFREDTSTPKQKWYDRVFECPSLIPMGLLPSDIQKEFKREFAGKRTLADGSPVYSTGKDSIEMLSKRPEFSDEIRGMLALLLEYAKLDKDMGTYYLREELDDAGNVIKQSGMLQYLTPDSIVYHVLNCTSTVTTRLSATRP